MKDRFTASVAIISFCLVLVVNLAASRTRSVNVDAPALAGCSQFTPSNAQTALAIGKVLCIAANAELDDQTVKTICNILDAEAPLFKQALDENRKASRRYARSAAACKGDAGYPGP